MRRLARPALSLRSQRVLEERQKKVDKAPDPRAEAKRLWNIRQNRTFQEIATLLTSMASGLSRCMYCEDSEGTAIDHFWPKAVYPNRAFVWDNYLLACSHCNSNAKRDQFPLDSSGTPLLIDPSVDDPGIHLFLSPSTGIYRELTEKGKHSKEVFGLNRGVLVQGRIHAWRVAEVLIVDYAHLRRDGRHADAAKILNTLADQPFSGVTLQLRRLARMPGAENLIRPECLQALAEFAGDFDARLPQ